MAASDPTFGVATPTGVLEGVAAFGWDGSQWQPSGRAAYGVGTPTGVLRGVAPFTWSGSAWTPAGRAGPSVPTPSGVLQGVAVYTWSGSAWTPTGGGPGSATPTGVLRGVAAFNWDGAAWQPAGQAGPDVATPFGVLQGVALFNWSGAAWVAGSAVPAPTLDLNFMTTPGALPSGVTFTRTSVGTYFDNTGTMQTAAANAPRWDYDPVSLQLRGLLVEEPRTNLLLNSATLGTQSATVTAAATTLSFYGTGTVTLSGASTAGPLTGTGAFPQRVSLTFTPTAGSLTLTVTGSVLNAQLETGAFRTSWIPTTGATVQRTLDTAVYAAAPLDANNGTLVVEVFLPQISAGANVEFATMDNGAVTDVMTARQAGGGNAGTALIFVAAVNVLSVNSTAVLLGVNKVGLTYARGAPNAVTVACNGGAVASGAPSSLPTTTRLTFGTGRNNPVNGHVRRVSYWNTVLPPSNLQGVTT